MGKKSFPNWNNLDICIKANIFYIVSNEFSWIQRLVKESFVEAGALNDTACVRN